MNRYLIDGVLRDARAGRRVIVVCGTRREARAALEDVAVQLGEGERAYRANGRERVRTTGGLVSFLPPTDALRGLTVDVVVVATGGHRPTLDKIDTNLRVLKAAGAEVIL